MMAETAIMVTGNMTRGQVGFALAEGLLAQGQRVYIVGRRAERVGEAALELQKGGTVWGGVADLSRPEGIRSLEDDLKAKDVAIKAVIHSAGGLHYYQEAKTLSFDQYQNELQANLTTVFLLGQWALTHLPAGGSFVAFSRAGQAQANMAAYNAAKAGVDALVRTFALEARERDIRFNAVAPGLVTTKSNLDQMKPESTKKWARLEDVVRVAIWLAGNDSAGITGQVIPVTGYGI